MTTILPHYIHRAAFLLCWIFLLLQQPQSGYAAPSQWLEKKLSINQTFRSVGDLMQHLQGQHIPLVFDDESLGLSRVKYQQHGIRDKSLRQVLEESLQGTPVIFRERNGYILLEKRPAQESGRLTGRVFDSRGKALPQASIRILRTAHSIQTGIDGRYAINLPAGTYAVQVSYLSHQTQVINDVQIRAGQHQRLDIAMRETSSRIEEITVQTTYRKASVAGLYAAQKNAATVTDGISAEQIERTPDISVGQVLSRVAGVSTLNNRSVIVRGQSDRYNQAQLDGVTLPSTSQNRRDFAFDIIPVEMVSSVVINKTASPDISSEFSGGQVSINTLDIPEKNFTSIMIGTGGNSQTIGKDFYRLGARNGLEYFGAFSKDAEFPDGIKPWAWYTEIADGYHIPLGEKTDPRFLDWKLTPNLPYYFRDLDALEQSRKFNNASMNLHKFKGRPGQNFRFAIGRVYEFPNKLKFGFSSSANFRNEQNVIRFNNVRGGPNNNSTNPVHWMDSTGFAQNGRGVSHRFNSSSGLVANLGVQHEKFKIALKNMYARTYSDQYNEAHRLAYNTDTRLYDKELYQLPEALSLRQHQITGQYQLPWKVKFDGMFTVSSVQQKILDERKLNYGLTTIIEGERYFHTPRILSTAQFSNLTEQIDSRMWSYLDQTDYNWATSLSRTFFADKNYSTMVKLGYQGWLKTQGLAVHRIIPMTRAFDENQPSTRPPSIRGNYAQIFDEQIGTRNNEVIYYPSRLGGNIYDGSMKSHSAYLMFDQQLFRKLRLVYGVRMEYFNLSNRQEELFIRTFGEENLTNSKFNYQLTVGEKDTRFLPSVNLTYSLTDKLNFRTSYAKTAIRPDFRETSYFGFYDYILDGVISGEKVVTTLIDNVDARLEWYPSPGEAITLTAYFKHLDKPIELTMRDQRTDQYVFANMQSARVRGLEMEVRKNFGFLGGSPWLENLFVQANGTLIKSSVDVLSAWRWRNLDSGEVVRRQERMPTQDRPLVGQSPWLLNLGLGYWGDTYGATLSYSHRGPRTAIISQSINRVEFELAPRMVDFQLYGKFLKKKVEARLNMANLLNEWTQFYRNDFYYSDADVEKQLEIGSPNPRRGDLAFNKEDGDTMLYRRQDGQRFHISLIYNF